MKMNLYNDAWGITLYLFAHGICYTNYIDQWRHVSKHGMENPMENMIPYRYLHGTFVRDGVTNLHTDMGLS